jgi:hypothetical protein
MDSWGSQQNMKGKTQHVKSFVEKHFMTEEESGTKLFLKRMNNTSKMQGTCE